jgi:hypothetical protein
VSSFGLSMNNTNVPVVFGIVPHTWAGNVHFDPQAIPNVIIFLLIYNIPSLFCLHVIHITWNMII